MVGKFVLVAFLCISLAQVQGNELETAKRTGLSKAKIMNEGGKRRIDASINEVASKSKLISSKTLEFVKKSQDIQERTKQALREVACSMEERAKVTNKPDSVIQCIKKSEENANCRIATLTQKFKTDMERLEKVKLANIETDSKPLCEMQAALKVRYERNVKMIENCENALCVLTANRSFGKWLDQLYANIRRIFGQVSTICGNFQRDANNYFTNTNRQINMIKSSSMRDMKNCVFRRDD